MANVKCQAIKTSILLENNNSFAGTLIIGTFEKRAPGLERREKKRDFSQSKNGKKWQQLSGLFSTFMIAQITTAIKDY